MKPAKQVVIEHILNSLNHLVQSVKSPVIAAAAADMSAEMSRKLSRIIMEQEAGEKVAAQEEPQAA